MHSEPSYVLRASVGSIVESARPAPEPPLVLRLNLPRKSVMNPPSVYVCSGLMSIKILIKCCMALLPAGTTKSSSGWSAPES